MGTRNLTVVIYKNEPKVAQYGQWDGYPAGQGDTAFAFLKNVDMTKFKEKLGRIKFIDEEKNKEINAWLKSIGVNGDWLTMEQSALYNKKYPLLSRDNGANILNLIMESEDDEIWLVNQMSFAADSLFCEWAYVIDLDKNTFEVYRGFNTSELSETERFAYLSEETKNKEYKPIKSLVTFDLNSLPETSIEFISTCEDLLEKEEEENE